MNTLSSCPSTVGGWVGGWWLTRQSLTEWYSAHYIGHYILVITLAIRLCIHYDNSGSVAISCIRIFLERKNKCFDLIKGLNTGALFCGAGKLHLRDSIRKCVSKTGRKGLSVGGLALIWCRPTETVGSNCGRVSISFYSTSNTHCFKCLVANWFYV